MASFGTAALSISGLCMVYNVALTAFRASTFEVFNIAETVACTATVMLVNLAVFSLGKIDSTSAKV